jgi:DNA-binding CsgD family transcriptional regulator
MLKAISLEHTVSRLHTLVEHCGRAEFPSVLMQFLAQSLDVDHLSLFFFDEQLIPHLVAAESTGPVNLAKRAGKQYESRGAYRYDPNTLQVRTLTSQDEQPALTRLRVEDINCREYREDIFERHLLQDRISLIDHFAGRWFVINLYRSTDSGDFSPEHIKQLELLAKLLSSLLEKNYTLLPPEQLSSTTRPTAARMEAVIARLNVPLSNREREVCARALLGMTNTGIGLELGIQAATVATLRKRAYAKFGISSLNELFALCLSHSP